MSWGNVGEQSAVEGGGSGREQGWCSVLSAHPDPQRHRLLPHGQHLRHECSPDRLQRKRWRYGGAKGGAQRGLKWGHGGAHELGMLWDTRRPAQRHGGHSADGCAGDAPGTAGRHGGYGGIERSVGRAEPWGHRGDPTQGERPGDTEGKRGDGSARRGGPGTPDPGTTGGRGGDRRAAAAPRILTFW